jgi:endonuclease YncB( thermonuclease family)
MSAMASDISGRVVGVSDGDTITVLIDGHENVKVRLTGIDAPEKSQPFGAVSKKNLSDQVFGKSVTVEWDKKDKYGRVLGRVLVNGTDVCLEQIKDGLEPSWMLESSTIHTSILTPSGSARTLSLKTPSCKASRRIWGGFNESILMD